MRREEAIFQAQLAWYRRIGWTVDYGDFLRYVERYCPTPAALEVLGAAYGV